MATTTFTQGTVITSTWLQDVNDFVYAGGAATTAEAVVFTPTGNLTSVTVAAALAELDSEKQPNLPSGTNKVIYTSSDGVFDLLDFKDEDAMTSNSDTAVPSQQSVKAYADTKNIATQVAPGTSGNLLTSNGTAWVSAATTLSAIKAWVHFDGTGSTGTNMTIHSSYNVASVHKTATGIFTVTFTSALSDAYYIVLAMDNQISNPSTSPPVTCALHTYGSAPTASSCQIMTGKLAYGIETHAISNVASDSAKTALAFIR